MRDQRRSILDWTIALVALAAMYVAVYPSVKGDSSYARLIDELPKAYRALFTTGTGVDFTSPAGYLDTELMTFMGPLVVLLYAIVWGAAGVAGEEDRGTLELLLANPVTRRRVVVDKWVALVGGVAVLSTVLWLALVVGGALAGMAVPAAHAAAALTHLGLLGAEYGTLALAVGAVTGRPTVARALPALLAAAAYLVNGLAPLVGWLRPIRSLSPFYQYIAHDPMRTGLSPTAVAVTVASTGALLLVAVAGFERRDLRL